MSQSYVFNQGEKTFHGFLGASLFTGVVLAASPVNASIDFSLLVGEWDDATVAIAQSLNTAEITVEISTLNQMSLLGKYTNAYSDEGESIAFERCERR